MSAPHTSPITTTATRSGSRVVVTRTDDVIAGAAPIIAVLSDDSMVLTFTPDTAAALSGILARAATAEIAVRIKVTNSYAHQSFEHVYDVTVPAPTDTEDLYDWVYDHLYEFSGEGPEYASTPAAYEVEILSAPEPFTHLVGLKVDSYG